MYYKNVWNLNGKICIITGANSGVGYGTALGFAAQNAHVVMLCRSIERGKASQHKIKLQTQNDKIDLLQVDLASQADIHRVAAQINSMYPHVDVLVNNPAIVPPKRQITEDGLETKCSLQ